MRLTERTRKVTVSVDVEAKLSGAAPRVYKGIYTLQIVMYCTSKDKTASAITG